jgi:hypothetical protein
MSNYTNERELPGAGSVKRHLWLRASVAVLASAATLGIAVGPAQAEVLGGCPSGGEWQLVRASVGPVATQVDQQGNNDSWACKTFVSGSGKVIDNRVQAGY